MLTAFAPTASSEATTHQSRAAGYFDAECDGAPPQKMIKFYDADDGELYPLFCGTSRFGYHHIKDRHGFTEGTDNLIASTLLFPRHVDRQGTARIFERRFHSYPEPTVHYRVVAEQKPYAGWYQGVITAYEVR